MLKGSSRDLVINIKLILNRHLWCQVLSTVRADDLHRISHHRTAGPGCRREAQRYASIRAALERETVGVLPMTLSELQAQVGLGEDSRRQFKQDMQSPDALAAEM